MKIMENSLQYSTSTLLICYITVINMPVYIDGGGIKHLEENLLGYIHT